jgi:hypothetical protein
LQAMENKRITVRKMLRGVLAQPLASLRPLRLSIAIW